MADKKPILAKAVAPIALTRKGLDVLVVAWNDGAASEYSAHFLRSACPCASCVNEWTGEKMLDDARIPDDIRPLRLTSVGRYAMAIHWSDGHRTGLYAYDYLRKLSPGADASGAAPTGPAKA